LAVDVTPDTDYAEVVAAAWAATEKPFAIVANLASGVDRAQAGAFGEVPILHGTRGGALAFAHLLAHRDQLALPPLANPVVDETRRVRWAARLADAAPLDEGDGLRLLADYGIPVVAHAAAATREEAIGAAERIGWPVALKTAAPGIAHKSDVGGVVLGLRDAAELRAAYDDLAQRLGPEVLVSAMAAPGVELALGIACDADFGPLVLVGAGGTLVEILGDRALALPGLDRERAARLLGRLRVRPLLDGARGRPPADLDAVLDALVRLSQLALELGDRLDGLDVNPLIAGPAGCVAADALIVARHPQ
jgi:acetate---CoA ligase (ADP-forming)